MVNARNQLAIERAINQHLVGDADGDWDVDITDFNFLAANFDPLGAAAPHGWTEEKFDDDNDIDITDFNELAIRFFPLSDGLISVPEPDGCRSLGVLVEKSQAPLLKLRYFARNGIIFRKIEA